MSKRHISATTAIGIVNLEFLLRFFRICDAFDGLEGFDGFWCRTDGEYAPVTIFANCADLFFWATADAEKVTPENIGELETAIADIKPFYEAWINSRGDENRPPLVMKDIGILLFCARARKMRPQGAYYDAFPPGVRELFDAAGPDRSGDKTDTPRREYRGDK